MIGIASTGGDAMHEALIEVRLPCHDKMNCNNSLPASPHLYSHSHIEDMIQSQQVIVTTLIGLMDLGYKKDLLTTFLLDPILLELLQVPRETLELRHWQSGSPAELSMTLVTTHWNPISNACNFFGTY